MARSLPPYTWKSGFISSADESLPSWADKRYFSTTDGAPSHYITPPDLEKPTSTVDNELGRSHLRSWPTLYNGTESPDGKPAWWKPTSEVDVLICGAGPFGLEVAVNLARQGINFRIVDKAEAPCLAGRADGLQPRSLEYLQSWGISHEASEEGPNINTSVVFRNGVKLGHGVNAGCGSRYKGIFICTQGQLEKAYVRDLLRHKVLIERCTTVNSFKTNDGSLPSHPITTSLTNVKTGEVEIVRAKYLIGADGASSSIREQLDIPFDGLATDCYWNIMDCVFKTDYPHILGFGVVINDEHGGCIILPREDGHTRFYVQITGEKAAKLAAARKSQQNRKESTVGETQIHDHGITPAEALEHLNNIMSPWKVEFASPLSWFAIWRVNERVARYFSTPDQRVHIGGDAAHVHSVLGAFGMNSSIYDAANLGWKLGLSIRGLAKPEILLPTYDSERRLFANRVIRCSGAYMRFICNLSLPLAQLRGLGDEIETHEENLPALDGTPESALRWMGTFFGRNSMFLLGVETPIVESAICPPMPSLPSSTEASSTVSPTSLSNGVRAPSARICFGDDQIGYLYDRMTGIGKFHILIFASDLQGPIREKIVRLSESFSGFYNRYGGRERFNVLLVVKSLTHETEALLAAPELAKLREVATIAYDDRAPDEDAHYQYDINHSRGAVVVVRPDLIVGVTTWPEEVEVVDRYFEAFLNPVESSLNGHSKTVLNGHSEDLLNSSSKIGLKGNAKAALNGHSEDINNGSSKIKLNGNAESLLNGHTNDVSNVNTKDLLSLHAEELLNVTLKIFSLANPGLSSTQIQKLFSPALKNLVPETTTVLGDAL